VVIKLLCGKSTNALIDLVDYENDGYSDEYYEENEDDYGM